LKGRDQLKNVKVDGRIMLEGVLDSDGSGYVLVVSFCGHGNEPSGFIKGM